MTALKDTPIHDRVRIHSVEVLSDDWYTLKKTTFAYLRNNGEWQTQSRETYDRGNGATILLYNVAKRTVILTRQFRFPTFVNGSADGLLVETAAGLLDEAAPEARIRAEVEEETGYRVQHVQKVFEAYMSPGSVTEKLYFFVAEYATEDNVSAGGGVVSEGEDIEVLELPFNTALNMIHTGEIADGKTIMLLQYAALHVFARSQ
jgi:nudix-type nucleoside diphosphatase (YffH/AdpP family)